MQMAGGNVCKFFLEGRCKFGDRCRYQHPSTGGGGRGRYDNQRGGGYRHQPEPSFDSGRRWDQKQGGNRFHLYSDTNRDSSSGGGGGNRDWGRGSNSDSGRDNRGDTRGGGGGRDWDNTSWRGNQQQDSRSQSYRGNRYSDSRSYGSRGGRGQFGDHHGGSSYDRQSSGGRYGGSSGRGDQGRYPTQEQTSLSHPRDIADQIRTDMEEWQSCMQWPLSCYAYHKETPCLPGLSDISPEELRWEAYQAKTKGTSEQYIQQVRELTDTHMKTLQMYARTNADDVEKLLSGQSLSLSALFGSSSTIGSDFFAPSTTAGPTVSSLFPTTPFQPTESLFGSSRSKPSSPLQSDSQPHSNTGGASLASSSGTTSGHSIFSTQQQTVQPSSTSQQTQNTDSSTTQHVTVETVAAKISEQLSKEELEAFKADKFVLGHIPEHAPPKELC